MNSMIHRLFQTDPTIHKLLIMLRGILSTILRNYLKLRTDLFRKMKSNQMTIIHMIYQETDSLVTRLFRVLAVPSAQVKNISYSTVLQKAIQMIVTTYYRSVVNKFR